MNLKEIDRPKVKDDEVLARVHAAGVDRGVWHIMTGLPYRYVSQGTGSGPPRPQLWVRTWPAL